MGLLKQAMTGEGGLLKRAGTERTPRRAELDSFTQIVSEISRTSVAACRGGSFRSRRGESGGGTEREHGVLLKESQVELPACEIISYRHDGKGDRLTRGSP